MALAPWVPAPGAMRPLARDVGVGLPTTISGTGGGRGVRRGQCYTTSAAPLGRRTTSPVTRSIASWGTTSGFDCRESRRRGTLLRVPPHKAVRNAWGNLFRDASPKKRAARCRSQRTAPRQNTAAIAQQHTSYQRLATGGTQRTAVGSSRC